MRTIEQKELIIAKANFKAKHHNYHSRNELLPKEVREWHGQREKVNNQIAERLKKK